MNNRKCAGCRKTSCNGCSLHPGKNITSSKNTKSNLPEAFVPEKREGYGLVFDVGTTTVAALLWNLQTGEMLQAETRVNPQRIAGSDVVGRVTYAIDSVEKQKKLQSLIVTAMDEMAEKLMQEFLTGGNGQTPENPVIGDKEATETVETSAKILKEKCQNEIREAVVVGNTAMCEILLGLSVEGLSKAPFHKAYQGYCSQKGKELGFSFLGNAEITVLPSIGGYVGADALAVYTYGKTIDRRKNVLAIDIGTNGEILLLTEDKTYACSAAAGPALEGAAVTQGMGAAPGAIEGVSLMGKFPFEDVYAKVIGDCEPKGICGSGLVDALAFLRSYQLVDEEGYLRSAEEARKAGVKERLCRRIFTKDGENSFLLTNEKNPVYLTAGDIRQLQLAKGAIRGAVQILLQKAQIGVADISHLYLAGAFGSYIKIESALKIGLLPEIGAEKVTHTGNCAALGAAMALFSSEVKKEMEQDSEEICHVELAKESAFQEYFMNYIRLP